MDFQPQNQQIYRLRAMPKPAPKTYKLMVDIDDSLPPQELIYRDDQLTLVFAMDWLKERNFDDVLAVQLSNWIVKMTGGPVLTKMEAEKVVQMPIRPLLPGSIHGLDAEVKADYPIKEEITKTEAEEAVQFPFRPLPSGGVQGFVAEVKTELPIKEETNDPETMWNPPGETAGFRYDSPQTESASSSFTPTNPSKRRRADSEEPITLEVPGADEGLNSVPDGTSRKHLTCISKTILQAEVRIGELETNYERLDISKSAHGHEERLQALENMVKKLVKENVSLGARLAQAHGKLKEQEDVVL